MTLALHQRGLFSWTEWAEALSARLKAAGAAVDGSDYYHHWLDALEDLVARKDISPKSELRSVADAWQRAAQATPHGQPIALGNDPFTQGSRSK